MRPHCEERSIIHKYLIDIPVRYPSTFSIDGPNGDISLSMLIFKVEDCFVTAMTLQIVKTVRSFTPSGKN